MTIIIDPQENEVHALQHIPDWPQKRVIEIGCGDGRLTLRLAKLGARVEAVDPDPKVIRLARAQLPASFARSIHYHVGSAGYLEYPAETFDRAVFSWVL